MNLFHVLKSEIKTCFPLKKFHRRFFNNIKTKRFVAPLIVLGKLEVSSGLHISPNKILKRTNKEWKPLEKDAQGG